MICSGAYLKRVGLAYTLESTFIPCQGFNNRCTRYSHSFTMVTSTLCYDIVHVQSVFSFFSLFQSATDTCLVQSSGSEVSDRRSCFDPLERPLLILFRSVTAEHNL